MADQYGRPDEVQGYKIHRKWVDQHLTNHENLTTWAHPNMKQGLEWIQTYIAKQLSLGLASPFELNRVEEYELRELFGLLARQILDSNRDAIQYAAKNFGFYYDTTPVKIPYFTYFKVGFYQNIYRNRSRNCRSRTDDCDHETNTHPEYRSR